MPRHHLKFIDLLKLSFRTFRVKPVRAILTVLGMSVGIGAVLFLISLGYGLEYILIGKMVTTEDSLITMDISYPSEINLSINKEKLSELRAIKDVAEVSPVAEFPGEVSSEKASSGLLVGTLIVEPGYFRLAGLLPDIGGTLTQGGKGIVLSAQTLSPLGMKADHGYLGKDTWLKVFYEDENTGFFDEASSTAPLPIAGIVSDESMPPTAIVLAESLSKEPAFYRRALVKAKDIESVESVRDQLLSRGFLVSARIDLVNQAKKIMNIITTVLGVFGVTALVVSAIGMFNTMIVGFLERIYEVGILKSLGATDEDVRNLFLMESMMMGLFGGIGGIILGLSAGKLVNLAISLVAVKLGGKSFELFITPSWFLVLIVALSTAIGLASGFWPAHRAESLSPKEAFTKK